MALHTSRGALPARLVWILELLRAVGALAVAAVVVHYTAYGDDSLGATVQALAVLGLIIAAGALLELFTRRPSR
jgi:hypothetical protein